MQVLVPKLIAATEKFDMVPKRDHVGASPVPCSKDTDITLPGAASPYFLKADAGPRYSTAGVLLKPLCGKAETNGKFSIARLEGSDTFANDTQHLASHSLQFDTSHHCFLIDMGSFSVTVAGHTSMVRAGETIFVPAGQEFSLQAATRYAALYVFTNGGGLVEMLVGMGSQYQSQIIAEDFPVSHAIAEVSEDIKNKVGVKIGESIIG
jgi:mannose-6-phosphate isomerase-like protein (cupin superfamily)